MPPAHKITTSQLQCLVDTSPTASSCSLALCLPDLASASAHVLQCRTAQGYWRYRAGRLAGLRHAARLQVHLRAKEGGQRMLKPPEKLPASCWVIGRSLRGNPAARTRLQSQAAAAWWHLSIHDSDSPLLYFHGQRQDAIWQGDCWQGDAEGRSTIWPSTCLSGAACQVRAHFSPAT